MFNSIEYSPLPKETKRVSSTLPQFSRRPVNFLLSLHYLEVLIKKPQIPYQHLAGNHRPMVIRSEQIVLKLLGQNQTSGNLIDMNGNTP